MTTNKIIFTRLNQDVDTPSQCLM